MNTLAVMIAPLAMLLPAAVSDVPDHPEAVGGVPIALTADGAEAPVTSDFSREQPWQTFFESHRPIVQRQVRIEQRVVIRIAPRPQRSQPDVLGDLPRGEAPTRMEERKMGSCLPIKDIAGVQASSDDRLILFMRDRKVISAKLEKSCSARDFYSGFYVERHKDGKLCIKRDRLQSRAGAKCELRQLRQLVPAKR